LILKATVSNKAHPEYGPATIPFPIPDSEYDRTIGSLEGMGLASPTGQDCRVDMVESGYPILNRLVAQSVNVDELDFLAKRLESFCGGEDDQFQAMASKLALSDIRDLINLTFCCQQTTVITDFSDLEKIGKAHSLNLNGGSMSSEEYDRIDGEAVALELIQSGAGTVTPYGVVYDNGMKLEQLYDGRNFPAYIYEPSQMVLEVSPAEDPTATGYLYLPSPPRQIERTLLRVGADRSELRKVCTMDDLPAQVSDTISIERESIDSLNRLCRAVAALDSGQRAKLDAVVLMAKPEDTGEIRQLAENLDQFDFIPSVKDPERNCQANDLGLVAYHGTLTLDELMREDPAEQYQREQEMGGML